jgi:hypothetical protein
MSGDPGERSVRFARTAMLMELCEDRFERAVDEILERRTPVRTDLTFCPAYQCSAGE